MNANLNKTDGLKDSWGHLHTLYMVVGVRRNGTIWVHTWTSGFAVVYRNKEKAEAQAKSINEEPSNGISKCQAIPFKPEGLQ